MNNLKNFTYELIDNLRSGELTKNNLRKYYEYLINNFSEIDDFDNYEDFQLSGSLFSLMLEADIVEDDEKKKLLITLIGYYLLSKGIVDYTFDNTGDFSPDKTLETIELLGSRISLVKYAKEFIILALRESDIVYNSSLHFPLMDKYENEIIAYNSMLIYDSKIITKVAESSLVSMIGNKEAIELGKNTLNNLRNQRYFNTLYSEGGMIHWRLYLYLKTYLTKNKMNNISNDRQKTIGKALIKHLKEDFDSDGGAVGEYTMVSYLKKEKGIETTDSEIKTVIKKINEPFNKQIIVFAVGDGWLGMRGGGPYMTASGVHYSMLDSLLENIDKW